MSHHTLEIPVRDLDTAKKRAYGFKARADELRHSIPLTHCYELLAASWGYKNWATVKTKLAEPSVKGAVQIGVVDEESQAAVSLPLSDCLSHVEIISSADRYATQDFVMSLASGLIRSGNGMFVAYSGSQKECINHIKETAQAAGRDGDVRIINLNPLYRNRKGWNLDIYKMLDRQGLADLLFESMSDYFGKGDRLYADRLRSAKSLTLALAALSELLEYKSDQLNAEALTDFLGLPTLWKLTLESGLPSTAMEPLLEYLRSQNIDPEKGPDTKAENAHHFHQTALLRVVSSHVAMQKDALSHLVDIGKVAQEGKIIVALLQHPNDMDSAESAFVRALMRVIGKVVLKNPAPDEKPFITVLEGADGYLRHGDSGNFFETVKAATSPAFVISERPLALPGLRGSAAIHVHDGINRPLDCVLVTDRARTEFVFRR
jgi:hypothetical protein